jgi:arsenate reductase
MSGPLELLRDTSRAKITGKHAPTAPGGAHSSSAFLGPPHRVEKSAGTQPGEHIHPEVAEVLEGLGLDTSREQPKLLTRDTIAGSDLAITLGCGEECAYVPGVTYRDWPVEDPGGQDEGTVRRIVADLDSRGPRPPGRAGARIELPPSVLDPR